METTTLPLTPEVFESGHSWEGYLSQMGDYREISERLYEETEITADLVGSFSDIVERRGGSLSISAMTEDWCGDSAVTLPFIARLAACVPGAELRIFIGKKYPQLKAAYAADGYESIPLLSFFDSDWSEIGRWMERPKPANAKVEAWVAERPRIGELMGNAEPAAKRELKSIFAGLVTEMADWYRDGLGKETLSEIRDVVD